MTKKSLLWYVGGSAWADQVSVQRAKMVMRLVRHRRLLDPKPCCPCSVSVDATQDSPLAKRPMWQPGTKRLAPGAGGSVWTDLQRLEVPPVASSGQGTRVAGRSSTPCPLRTSRRSFARARYQAPHAPRLFEHWLNPNMLVCPM